MKIGLFQIVPIKLWFEVGSQFVIIRGFKSQANTIKGGDQ